MQVTVFIVDDREGFRQVAGSIPCGRSKSQVRRPIIDHAWRRGPDCETTADAAAVLRIWPYGHAGSLPEVAAEQALSQGRLTRLGGAS